jgi:hypothetical protein
MQTIMVQGESVSDVNLVIALAKKLNLKIKVISSENNVSKGRILDNWNDLSICQQEGLLEAIKQIDDKRGIPNSDIMTKYRSRYHG